MNLIIPNGACKDWLAALIDGDSVLTSAQAALFDVELPVNQYSELSTFLDAECSFDGYSRWNLIDWTTPIVTAPLESSTQPRTPEFTINSGSVTLYGLFITELSNTRLFMAGLFDDPITIADSRTLYLEFVLTLSSRFTS